MKRILPFVMAIALLAVSITACGGTDNSAAQSPAGQQSAAPQSQPQSNEAEAPVTSTRLGLGSVTSMEESTPATAEASGSVQTEMVICALALDGSDTILSVKFDTVSAKAGFDLTGAFTGDLSAPVQSKKELGDDYGLKAVSGIGKEWYEQIEALERWMVGKTVSEVLEMKATEDGDRSDIPDEEELKTSVTISVGDQLRALQKAYDNAE